VKRINVTTEQPGVVSLHHPKFVVFYVLVLGASLAWPTWLGASASALGRSLNSDSQWQGSPGKAPQPQSSQLPPKGNGGQVSNQSPAQSERPKSRDGHPQQEPSRSGTNPRPPEAGDPAVKPGRADSGPSRPPTHSHPPAHSAPRPPVHHYPTYGAGRPRYSWGASNGWRLHQFFLGDMQHINRMHRHYFYAGGHFPPALVSRIEPVPHGLMLYLPPAPPGLELGYYDGYCLLYDPWTLRIVSVIDLYRY
jgi:hypothetical protein